jgi:hypothetical protein
MATIRYKMGHLPLRVSGAEATCFRPPNASVVTPSTLLRDRRSHGEAQASFRSVIKNAWRETDRLVEKDVHYLLDLVSILKVPMIEAMKGTDLAFSEGRSSISVITFRHVQ